VRTEIDSMPAELDETLRRVMQLEIEREALKGKGRCLEGAPGQTGEELANLRADSDATKASGRRRTCRAALRTLREQTEQVKSILKKPKGNTT